MVPVLIILWLSHLLPRLYLKHTFQSFFSFNDFAMFSKIIYLHPLIVPLLCSLNWITQMFFLRDSINKFGV